MTNLSTTVASNVVPVICDTIITSEYNVVYAAICSTLAFFGLVYTYFGYRCFKAVMFLSGLIVGGTTAYLLCREERIFQQTVSLEIAAGISVGIGVLCGLITLLVRYVGMFLQGFFLGLLFAFAGIMTLQSFYHPSTPWIPGAILFGTGILCSLLTLKFQRKMIILSTAVFGSMLITACVDYFLEDFHLMWYAWESLMANPTVTMCWYTWVILAIWPTLSLTGIVMQWKVTAKGYEHTDVIISGGRRKQVRTHLVRPHRGPQGGSTHSRPPAARSGSVNPTSRPSEAPRRAEARRPPASHREISNQPQVEAHQLRVDIDHNEAPPSYFECVELGVGEPVRSSSDHSYSGSSALLQLQEPSQSSIEQQLLGNQGYVFENEPPARQGYVASAQARSSQQAQSRAPVNHNRNHESIDQFSRPSPRNQSQARPNAGPNRRKASGPRRYRVSPSTSDGASASRNERSDTQRLLPDPQRAGTNREAIAVLAQFVQGVEDRRSSGQLLSTNQSSSGRRL